MDATRITITDMSHEAELRSNASPDLYVDVTSPEIAYLCSHCGAPIAFGMADMPVTGETVQCGICGTESSI